MSQNSKKYRPGKYHPWRAEIPLSREGRKRLAERKLRKIFEQLENKQ